MAVGCFRSVFVFLFLVLFFYFSACKVGLPTFSRWFFVLQCFWRRNMLHRFKSTSLNRFAICRANQQMLQLTTKNSLSKSDCHYTGRSRFQQVKLVIVTFKRDRSQHTLSLRGYSAIGPAFTVRLLRNCRFLFSKLLLVRRIYVC